MSLLSQLTSCCRLGLIGVVAKWVMITENLSQSIFGAIFIGLGFASSVAEAVVDNIPIVNWFVKVDWFSAPLIATGIFIYLLTMMGCIAAYKELKCFIALYAIIMTVLVVGEVTLVYYGLDAVRDRTKTWVVWAYQKPYMRQPFYVMEARMHCCGIEGPESYTDMREPVPPSCCEKPVFNMNHTAMICDDDEYKGCAEVVPKYLQKLADHIGNRIYYAIGVQTVDVITSVTLFNAATPS